MATPVTDDFQLSQRTRALAFILIWEGRLGRGRVMSAFDLSAVRASEWIRELRDMRPDWMFWDSVGRRYLPTQSAFAAYARLNSAESAQAFNAYIGQKGAAAFGDGSSDVLCAALPLSVPDPQVFSVFSQASESSRAAEVVYQSMQNPQPHLRIIEPHHLVQAGRRWHARAFCRTSNEYRDYALGRVISAKLLQEKADHGVDNDFGWQTTVPLELIPHPLLSADQAQVVCFENFAGQRQRVIACRAALVHYFIQAVRAAVSPDDQRPPDYQLAVKNAGSLQPWLFQGSISIEAR